MRYADQFGDYLSDDYNNAEREASKKNLATLSKIKRDKLSETDEIAFVLFM
jgi:hypothetical protein